MSVVSSKSAVIKSIAYCEDIDVFLDLYTPEGMPQESKTESELNVDIFKPSMRQHAKQIVNIYRLVYKGTYPFKEMLDEEYVFQTFENPAYWWGIFSFKSTDGSAHNSEIVGCFTIVTDKANQTAYMRGLNILPRYQGRVGVRALSYALIYRYFQDHPGILRWYTEARTAHPIVQHLADTIGAHGCALLVNKDYFFHRKETDCFMVGYKAEVFERYRREPIVLPLFAREFYEFSKHQFELPGNPVFIDLGSEDNVFSLELNQIRIEITEQSFGYWQVDFNDTESHNVLSCLFTSSVKNIEKVKWSIDDPQRSIFLFLALEQFMDAHQIEYCEVCMPVSEIQLIGYLHQLHWHVAGYIPAWQRNDEGTFDDCLVFYRTAEAFVVPGDLKLIPTHHELLRIVHNEIFANHLRYLSP